MVTHPIPREALKESIAIVGRTGSASEAERKERTRAYFVKYRAEHPKLKDYYRAYYRANKEKWLACSRSDKRRAYMKQYRETKRTEIAASTKAWRERNQEKIRAQEQRRRVAGRPNKPAQDARWQRANPERHRASIARAKAAKPELYRQHAVKTQLARRARLRGVTTEPVSLSRIVSRDRGLCHLCGLRVPRAERTFDHLVPIARNGAHAEWNLMLAHELCNKRRGVKRILRDETKAGALEYINERGART